MLNCALALYLELLHWLASQLYLLSLPALGVKMLCDHKCFSSAEANLPAANLRLSCFAFPDAAKNSVAWEEKVKFVKLLKPVLNLKH